MNIKPSDIKRFWSKVNKDGPIQPHVPHLGKCWEWTGGIMSERKPYGGFWLFGTTVCAHQASVMVDGRTIPRGKIVMHLCDNCRCVNPSHLKIGTFKENSQDSVSKGRHAALTKPDSFAKGSANGMAKLCENDVREIRRRVKGGESMYKLSKVFDVQRSTIRNVVRCIWWRHVD